MGTILKPYHLQLTPVTGGMGYDLWVRFSDKKEDWLGVSLLLDSGDTLSLPGKSFIALSFCFVSENVEMWMKT